MASGRMRIGYPDPALRILTADQGSYALTGQAALLTPSSRILVAGQGSYALTGQAVTLTFGSSSFDFYISPTGTGSASSGGTLADPWPISMLNNSTARSRYAGLSVGLMDGTYDMDPLVASNTDFDQWGIDVQGGSSGSPTIIKAVNKRQAVLATSTHNSGGTPIFGHSGGVGRGYVTIDGLKFTGGKRAHIRIGINGITPQIAGITIKNCEVTGANGSSLPGGVNIEQFELNQCTAFQIQNNYFHDNVGYGTGDPDHFSSILCWRCDRGIIEYNTSVGAGGIYGKVNGNYAPTIRYNYIDLSHLTLGIAIQDWVGSGETGADTYVYNNILIACQCIVLLRDDSDYINNDVYVYNNTCDVLSGGAPRGIQFRGKAGGIRIYNNIIVDPTTGDHTMIAVNTNGPGIVDYNLYNGSNWSWYSSGVNDTSRDSGDFAAYKSAMGTGIDANSISGSDPLFTGTGTFADKYKLQGSSPAKSQGRVGGVSGGATVSMGAWDDVVTQIGAA